MLLNISVPSDYEHKIKYLVLLLLLAFYYGIVDSEKRRREINGKEILKNQRKYVSFHLYIMTSLS